MFGVTLGTYNKFEELYKFLMRTKNTFTSVGDNIKNQMNEETYIKELQMRVEEAKGMGDRSEYGRNSNNS